MISEIFKFGRDYHSSYSYDESGDDDDVFACASACDESCDNYFDSDCGAGCDADVAALIEARCEDGATYYYDDSEYGGDDDVFACASACESSCDDFLNSDCGAGCDADVAALIEAECADGGAYYYDDDESEDYDDDDASDDVSEAEAAAAFAAFETSYRANVDLWFECFEPETNKYGQLVDPVRARRVRPPPRAGGVRVRARRRT